MRTESLRDSKTASECTVDYVVFLNRLDHRVDTPILASVPQGEALRRLCQEDVWPPELSVQQERGQAIERLLDAELLELTYREFDPAIGVLEQVITRGKS